MRKAVLLLAFVAVFLPLSASSQPVIIVDSLNRSLCGNIVPWGETIQYISIYNPDTNLQRLDFAIRMHSPDGASIHIDLESAITFYNGFESAFSPAPVLKYLTQDGDDWVLTIRSFYHPDFLPEVGLPASSDTVTYIGLEFDPSAQNDLHFCFDSTNGTYLSGWLAAPGPAPVFGGEVCHQVDRLMPTCKTEIWDFAGALSTSGYCHPISYSAEVDECSAGSTVDCIVTEGPGTVDYMQVFPGMGWVTYGFTPAASDYGRTYDVEIQAREDWCGDGSYYRFSDPVNFTVTVGTGDALVGDLDGSGVVDISDLQQLIYIMFIEPQDPADPRICNIDCAEGVDITDVSVLVDHLFLTLTPLCGGC